MNNSSYCQGLILSKKGFGAGHLLLNFLDSERGKLTLTVYGGALETGSRRAGILSGSFIEGLLSKAPRQEDRLLLSEVRPLLQLDDLREDLQTMGFIFFTLEILDLLILEGDLFPYYEDLYHAFDLFNRSIDEKYILFFIAKFLSYESWIDIPEKDQLPKATQRFIHDAMEHSMDFLSDKYISPQRCKELSYFFALTVQKARNKTLNSLELLRFRKL